MDLFQSESIHFIPIVDFPIHSQMDLFQSEIHVTMDLFQSNSIQFNGSIPICKIPWVSLNPVHRSYNAFMGLFKPDKIIPINIIQAGLFQPLTRTPISYNPRVSFNP